MSIARKDKRGRYIYLPSAADALSGIMTPKARKKKRAKKTTPKRKR